jgi:hypothetical protein
MKRIVNKIKLISGFKRQKSEFGRRTRRRPIERDYVAARWGSRKKDEGEKLGRCEGERRNEMIMEVGNKMSTNRSSPCPLSSSTSFSIHLWPYTFRFEPFAVRRAPVCSPRNHKQHWKLKIEDWRLVDVASLRHCKVLKSTGLLNSLCLNRTFNYGLSSEIRNPLLFIIQLTQ